jgi:hypothetical protein
MEPKGYVLELINIVKNNSQIMDLVKVLERLGITDYYIGAGAVVQSVWNTLEGNDINYGISDIDIIYYDADQLDKASEMVIEKRIKDELGPNSLEIDVTNEAAVHLWYKAKNGHDINQYSSCEDAINSWPTTATALGVRKSGSDWTVYAPFGLEDIFNRVIRANNRQITEAIYQKKCDKWTKKWHSLSVIPWNNQEVTFADQVFITCSN